MIAGNSSNQTPESIRANAAYFLNNIKEYEHHVQTIDTYARLHDFVSRKVRGTNRMLDVGNGGVFAYDTAGVGEITALDLFLDALPEDVVARYFPANARAKQGSALAIPESDDEFDAVLMVMLLHHLTGRDWQTSWQNACTAIAEAVRVLRPGGRLVIVESCVPAWFFAFERPAFWMLTRTVGTVFSHPITIQFPPDMIRDEIARHCADVKVERVPKGRSILQFGFKVPSFATPAQPYAFEATKS